MTWDSGRQDVGMRTGYSLTGLGEGLESMSGEFNFPGSRCVTKIGIGLEN